MSMKYEYLQEKVNELMKLLQQETVKATNEDDMEELEYIAEDIICKIPTQLLQKDYYTRSAVRRFIDSKYQNDTSAINNIMNLIYDKDVVSFDYDSVNNDIQEMADKFADMSEI